MFLTDLIESFIAISENTGAALDLLPMNWVQRSGSNTA